MAKKSYAYKIGAQHIDFRKRVSLVSLTNLILNTAGKNADQNGFGLLKLQAHNYTWVLSRLVVDMNRFPTDSDELNVETWVESVGVAFTNRNFRITDKQGDLMGYAASSWAVIDMGTRRTVLLDTLPGIQRYVVPESTPLGEAGRISNIVGEVRNSFKVKYSNLDINRHANSLHYIQWISDCLSLDYYLNHHIHRFEINFLKELTFGDEGEVFVEERSSDDFYFQIVTKEKGTVCRARLVFKEV